MTTSHLLPAKVTAPRMALSLPRQHLWKRLEEATCPSMVWLQAPAGYGKTMGVAAWLQSRGLDPAWYRTDEGDADPASIFGFLARLVDGGPEQGLANFTADFQLGLAAFGRRWFERWWALRAERSPGSPVLVFDDYQEAGSEGTHHELLRCALERMPADGRLIVMSRQAPPAAWSRLMATGELVVIDAASIALTAQEAQQLAQLREPGWPMEAIARVSQACEGWAAGLVLLMQDGRERWSGRREDPVPRLLAQLSQQPERLEDFFVHEVIRRLPDPAVQVLRCAAWLPVALVDVVEDLSGQADAGHVLESLHRSGTFTLKVDRRAGVTDAYQFHPLFLACLRSAGVQGADAAAIRDRQAAAAHALDARGYREEAVGVALMAHQWEQAARWIHALYAGLTSQGRHRTLLRWLAEFPDERIQSDAWLLLTRGEGRTVLMDASGVADLEQACDRFDEQDDQDGLALSLHALSLALITRPDADPGCALQPFERMAALDTRWSGTSAARLWMLRTLTTNRWFSDPSDPRLTGWLEELRERATAMRTPDALALWLHPEFLLSLLRGDHDRVRMALRELDGIEVRLQSPNLQAFCRFLRVYALNKLGEHEEAVAAFESGAAAAAQEGALIWAYQISMHGVEACIGAGRLQQAQTLLETLQRQVPVERGFASIFHSMLAGWVALAQGDLDRALAECRRHEQRLATADVRLFHILAPLTRGWVHLARDEVDEADRALNEAHGLAERIGSRVLCFDARLAQSEVAHRRGDIATARRSLSEALQLGREHRYISVYYARPRDLSRVMARALDGAEELDYVRHFIRARQLPPPQDLPVLWCWPLRIRTLGGFTLEREAEGRVEPLVFGPKAPRKLLALLKAVIALGQGSQVREDLVLDAVWPELEADQAQAALKVAVSRLNALLGEPGGWIAQRSGQVVLDAQRIWVDVWALERRWESCPDPATVRQPAGADGRPTLPWLDLYRGPFLVTDAELAWAHGPRERWRQRAVRAWVPCVETLRQVGDPAGALMLAEQAFALDDLAEPLAIQCMELLLELGQRLRGVTVFEQLREALGRDLGLRPSARALELHRQLIHA